MIKDFLAGITAYGRALSLIGRLRLWSYFLLPALISILLAGLIFVLAWKLGDNIGSWLISWYPWPDGQAVATTIANIFGGILIAVLGLILYKNLVMALASPFMSALSERIEKHYRPAYRPRPFSTVRAMREVVRGLRLALRNIARELLFTLLLLPVGLIPLLGPFVAVGIFLIQSYYFGFGSMDYTLERHLDVRGSIRFVQNHRWLAIGNGAVALLLLMTGIGFLLALPLSTAAVTPQVIHRLDATK